MWAIKPRPQHGATLAEFALSVLCFFTAMFFVLEVSRALYLWNTLQEATRRAAALAAVSDFSNAATMAKVRQAAVLRDSAGTLPLGMPVSDAHIRIDYLSLTRNPDNSLSMTPIPSASMPACPARARLNCIANPYGGSCIRFVRVRLCAPGADACGEVQYQPLSPLTGLSHMLPQATTIAKAESLGYQAGSSLCP
ncbi:pilus assembly protein [Duganella sp. FT135W]|uniref:Pilus assembly protein n=1 Tax=Duganella flavida TaxID=2692175 RepID=A0A6L8KD52_9BURK|nr:TadE/TadG family type IV pilus assembly protein [Duganella flavida]MYM25399.1 pilus assembly protein [Duganella flavida]